MSQSSIIDAPRHLIFTRICGELTSEAVFAQRRELGRDQRFEPTFRHLLFVDISASALSMEEIGRLAESSIFASSAVRVFVARTDLAFSFMQVYGAYAYLRGLEIALFRTDEEAAAFLEVEAGDVVAMRQQLTGVTPPRVDPIRTDVRMRAPAGRIPAASEWDELSQELHRMRESRAPQHATMTQTSRVVLHRELGAALELGDGRLDVSLVPRRGVPVDRWKRAPEDSRLRLVSSLEVRFVEPAPPDWEAMPPEWLARVWDGAEPA